MRHVIVFLFDTSEFTDIEIGGIENQLCNSKTGSNTDIYYLKIVKKKNQQYNDSVFQVISGDNGTSLVEVKRGLNLRNGESLKIVLNKIIDPSIPQQSYFINCGHGAGLAINIEKLRLKFINNLNEFDKVRNLFKPENFNEVEKELIWNYELAEALHEFSPLIGIFNNCDTNYLDSLLYFSRTFKYCIGTQTYTSISMLPIAEIISYINKNEGLNSEVAAKELFSIYSKSAEGVISSTLEKTSLFLTESKFMPDTLDACNDLCEYIMHNYFTDLTWYNELNARIANNYLNGNNSFIDLIFVMEQICELKNYDLTIHKKLNVLKESSVKLRTDKYIRNDHIKDRNGINIYLPRKGHEISNMLYLRYISEFRTGSEEIKWNSLLFKLKDHENMLFS